MIGTSTTGLLNRPLLVGFFIAICLQSTITLVPAQSGGVFEITEAAIATGSTAMSADDFQLDSTLGQSAAGGVLAGGNFAVTSGIWNYTPLGPTAAPERRGTL